jgi:CRP/FNR family cyclic AMP-dependent transcriptional regulator
MQPNLTAILSVTDIFDSFTPAQLELVAAVCELQTYQQGDAFLRENEDSDDIYVIARGTVQVWISSGFAGGPDEQETEPVQITELRQGQVVGEVALVDQGFRSATARAGEDNTLLVRIPRIQLMAICDSHPEIGYKLMKNLAADLAYKIRDTDMTIRRYQLMLSAAQADKS